MVDTGIRQRRRKRKKGEQRFGTCIFCGNYRPITTDHVISKCLFAEVAHSTLRVDACQACQTGKGRGEQQLWRLVNLDIEGERHPVAALKQLAIVRDELRYRREFNRNGPLGRALESRATVDLVTPSGLIVGQGAGLALSLEPVLNTLRYSVRGLYYHRFGRMLDPYAPVEVAYIPFEERGSVREMLRHMPMEAPIFMPTLEVGAGELVAIPRNDDQGQGPIVVPDAVAVIVPFVAEDDDEPAALWGIVFNRAVTFLGGTENYASVVKDIHTALNPGT